MRINMRRQRAEALASSVMRTIDAHLHPETRRKNVFLDLVELFSITGVEIVTDHIRKELGLPPRGPDGWTIEELKALEQARLAMLLKPMYAILPKNEDQQQS